MSNTIKWTYLISVFFILLFLIWFLLFLWLIFDKNTLSHPLVNVSLFPVACTSKGCITTKTWLDQYKIQSKFSEFTKMKSPTPEDALTSVIRQYLIMNSFLRVPVTVDDARRYREEILQSDNEALIFDATGLSFEKYDEMVILPLLQQEALKQDRKVETLEDLFSQIGRARWVSILPIGLKWDKNNTSVIINKND